METLQNTRTKSSPEIFFNPVEHTLSIHGETYPENAFTFFEPLFDWVDTYLTTVSGEQKVIIKLDIPYMNTSSTKCYMMLLEKFEDAYLDGKSIELNWYYNAENENEIECAQEFQEDFTFPFELIEKVVS